MAPTLLSLLAALPLLLQPPAAAQMMKNPCRDATSGFASMPFCNAKLSLEARVSDAIQRMTLAEKIGALGTKTPAIASLGLLDYNWWNEATGGVSDQGHPDTQQTTHFPYPITTGMSFNRSLWKKVGGQIGREARALANVGKAYSTFWTPVVNLAREPRWGRNIETPGEDPYLTSEYAEHFVKGFQEAPEDPGHIQSSACCKHFVANEMEKTAQSDGETEDREHVNTNVTMQDLIDSYMRPFQACVEKGRVSGLMCSYNEVNGVPSCANKWLLTTVAREAWGFDGYITSDCDADADVYSAHHYAATPEEAVRDVLQAGTDIDCEHFVPQNAQSALDKGLITEEDINARLRKLFRVRMRLGHFDPIGPLDGIPESTVCSDYATRLSAEAVTQSAVLLKNDNARLPLDRGTVGTVAIIGPLANYSKQDSSYYGPDQVCGDNFWTVVDAVAHGGIKSTTDLGVPTCMSDDQSGIPAAVELAKSADTVVLAVGTDLQWAKEGQDATSITFSPAQKALIDQVAAASAKPMVVAVMTATPLDLSELLANTKIGAVLHLGQPSTAVLGLGAILYGDASPAGRMIQTVYSASYADQISIFDFNMRPGPSPFGRPDCQPGQPCAKGTNPGRTYRFYTGKAVVPFGFGLSYSTFKYTLAAHPVAQKICVEPLESLLREAAGRGRLSPSSNQVTAAQREKQWGLAAQYRVEVTNTGRVAADDVVLGFIVPPGAGQNGMPLKYLFGFERVHLRPGESKTVTLLPALTDFAHPVGDGDRLRVVTGEYRVQFGISENAPHGMGYLDAGSLMVESGGCVVARIV